MSNDQDPNDKWSAPQWPQGDGAANQSRRGDNEPTEAIPPQNQWHDPQWASPGQHEPQHTKPFWRGQNDSQWQGQDHAAWAQQDPQTWPGAQQHSYGASSQWQGQAGQFYDPNQQFYDPNQQYYDPNNPHAWQGAQMPGSGPPPKPAYKQWWFWSIIGIVVIGIVVLIFALFLRDDEDPNATDPAPTEQTDPTPADPTESLDPSNDPEVEEPDPAEGREDNGGMAPGTGGSSDDALAAAQERIDSAYSYWGPDDMAGLLEIDGYDSEAVDYAITNLDVDWEEQAAGQAQELVDSDYNGYSQTGIEDYLEYSGFESQHIDSALNGLDVNYNEQAVEALESYRDLMDDSTDEEARSYLSYTGFTDEQIDHAFSNAG